MGMVIITDMVDQHSWRKLSAKRSSERRIGATASPGGSLRAALLGHRLRSAQNAPQNGAGLHSVCGQGGIFLEFRGGEFSAGEMENFQSALTGD
jgi:hypothetical protein